MKFEELYVGQEVELGWNIAKVFSEYLAYSTVTIVSLHPKYIVIKRDEEFYCAAFNEERHRDELFEEITLPIEVDYE